MEHRNMGGEGTRMIVGQSNGGSPHRGVARSGHRVKDPGEKTITGLRLSEHVPCKKGSSSKGNG